MFLNAFPDLQITLEDLIAEGDKVVDRGTIQLFSQVQFSFFTGSVYQHML